MASISPSSQGYLVFLLGFTDRGPILGTYDCSHTLVALSYRDVALSCNSNLGLQ